MTTTFRGYHALIADAVTSDDEDLLELVEDFMRLEHSTLDALSRTAFMRLARRCLTDIQVWHDSGAVHGVTLAEYCEISGLAYPKSLTTKIERNDQND